MNVQDKITKMESARGKNHPLSQFRQWLDAYLPAHALLNKIQVGGTNGKGSTCQWLRLFLQKEGYQVGMFTSPHLICHTERIRVNDDCISLSDWERIYDQYADLFESKHMTMFEMDLWMAIAYFIEQDVDYALIEVGMGGRLDATTSLDYLATLITNVGKDHTEFLGDTLEEIAIEKAGIFDADALALTSEKSCFSVLEAEAEKRHAFLNVADYDVEKFDLSSIVTYQKENLQLALTALDYMGLLDESIVQDVIDRFGWDGRFMKVHSYPDVIVDGAHNVPGIQALVKSACGFQGHIYFSVLKEKDAHRMIELLETLHCPITLVHFDSYRLYQLSELEEEYHLPVIDFEECVQILKNPNEDCLVCGSLYFVGDVLKSLSD